MDFEEGLEQIKRLYERQGYEVILHPRPEDLPPFAKNFRVEMVAKRGAGGVLVSAKNTPDDLADATDLPRYAEVTAAQPGWRFDFGVLQEGGGAREARGVL